MNYNHAYGALMGSFVGDAAGCPLEFFRKDITEEIALYSMNMPGGGVLKVGKGQYSDDSELALELCWSLYNKHPNDGFPLEDVAKGYLSWYNSNPFDIGMTCRRAFSINKKTNISSKMIYNACNYSMISEANGALMRLAPIAVWCYKESPNIIVQYAKMDALLSHPNQVCQDCNAIIALVIAYLINNPKNYIGAIEYISEYINNINNNVHIKVRDWFKDSVDISNLDCTKNIGHVKWAFMMALYYLRNNVSYEKAIKDVIMHAGDCDTNSAIVGGVLGALHGIDGIPEYMIKPVLDFDPTNPGLGHKRPEKYTASNVSELTICLLSHNLLSHNQL